VEKPFMGFLDVDGLPGYGHGSHAFRMRLGWVGQVRRNPGEVGLH
jgi:hypothetical protein